MNALNLLKFAIGKKINKFVFLFIFFFLMVSGVSAWAGGDGTPASPYQVSNWTDLSSIQLNTTASYILMNNLTSSDGDYSGIGSNWYPLNLSGNFNGSSYVIDGLKVNASGNYRGLFGNLTGNASELEIINANVQGSKYLGILAGITGSISRVTNVYVTGNVTATGGDSATSDGGLIGSSLSIVNNCWSNVTLISNNRYVGGLIGTSGNSVNNSYSLSKVTSTYSTGGGIGGGLIGRSSSSVDNSSWKGFNVSAVATGGGLVGYQINGAIRNSYAEILSGGSVSGDTAVAIAIALTDSGSGRIAQNITGIINVPVVIVGNYGGVIGSWSGITLSGVFLIVKNATDGSNITMNMQNTFGNGAITPFNPFQLRNNFAYYNISYAIGFNKSANISFANIPTNFTNPAILKDGAVCGTACYNFTSLNAGTVKFNVSGWSNYTIGEFPNSLIVINSIPLNNLNITNKSMFLGCNASALGTINITSVVLNVTNGSISWTQTNNSYNAQSFNATFTNNTILNGTYSWNCIGYSNDGSLNTSSAITIFNQKAYTLPTCTLISRFPAKIYDNSTGRFNVMFNCTSPIGVGINITYNDNHYWNFVTRTVDDLLTPGIPNAWSIRPPVNNLTTADPRFPDYPFFRAEGRNRGFWYDSLGLNSTINNDTITYAIEDGHYSYIAISNLTIINITSTSDALFNYSSIVEMTAFRQNIPLSYDSLVDEMKKNYSITNNDVLLIKQYDLERLRGSVNYTMIIFADLGFTSLSPRTVRNYYCNSSYNINAGVQVPTSTNCVLLTTFDETAINTKAFTDRNSSYVRSIYSITNDVLSGIRTTNQSYLYYDVPGPARTGQMKYVNGSTITNMTFAQTNTTWTSTNGGTTWTNASWTADIITTSTKKSDDEFQFGVYARDLNGNVYSNFTFFVDDITVTNHPISQPYITEYNSTGSINDINKNGTHKGIMNILVQLSVDPDSIGNVTYNLTLRNLDGTWNYTINGSFVDGNLMWLNFNTSLVKDGKYRMNITAVSGDNPSDIESDMTIDNFTIDNTAPNITIVSPANNTFTNNTLINFTANLSDVRGLANATLNIYNQSGTLINQTTTTFLGNVFTYLIGIPVNLVEGVYQWFYNAFDNVGNFFTSPNQTLTIDTTNPMVSITYPLNQTYNINVSVLNYTIRDTNLNNCWYNLGGADIAVTCGDNLTGLTSIEGSNTWKVYVNDSAGNINVSSVTFTKDTIAPAGTLISPSHNSYSNNPDVNFTANFSDVSGIKNITLFVFNQSGYLINETTVSFLGGVFNTITGVVVNLADGVYQWFYNVFDNVGNFFTSTNRTVTIDTILPQLNITYPLWQNYSTNVFELNYTLADVNPADCWYSLDEGIVNISVICGNNLTSLTSTEGTNNWTIYANDSAGNNNSRTVSFFKDTVVPQITIIYPENLIYNISIDQFIFNISEANIDHCNFTLDGGLINYSIPCADGINAITGLAGNLSVNLWSVSVYDTSGNVNSSSIEFNVTLPPIIYPLNQSFSFIPLNPSDLYVDVNVTYPFVIVTNATLNLSMYINGTGYSMSHVGNQYILNLLFDTIGNYPFIVNASNHAGSITGTFIVRQPYYINFTLYRDKPFYCPLCSDRYIDNFAYVTAEFTNRPSNSPYNHYDPTLEKFVTPIGSVPDKYKKPVFSAPYINGEATIKLYEGESYAFRLVSGQVYFPATFSLPNVTKEYKTEVYIGKYSLNGTNTDYQLHLSKSDINPYGWLFNWIYGILLVVSIIGAIFLFFTMPETPMLSVILGIGSIIILTVIRIIVWLWLGA